MSILSKLSNLPARPVRDEEIEAASENLKLARHAYQQSSMELFELCHQIQISGELPGPPVLTRAVAKFRHAREIMETMEAEMPEEMVAA